MTELDAIQLTSHQTMTIGIATTSGDSRDRQGAVTTVLPGRQTQSRAW